METGFSSQLAVNVTDDQLGHLGYLVIDSTIRGKSAGGIRMQPNVTLTELTNLARTMTLKSGLLGLPFGGAKAGIIADPFLPRKRKKEILKAFGKNLSPFIKNGYFPGSDMGTDNDDIILVMKSATPRWKATSKGTSSHTYTGWTVFASAKAAAEKLKLRLSNCTVAIQGFGKVGSSVAEAISQTEATVVAVSTNEGAIYEPNGLDIEKLLRLKEEAGDDLVRKYEKATTIAKEDLLLLGVDILFPCAGSWSINSSNVEKVKSKIICPGANIPVTPEAEENLFRKGKLCLPDFVTNCGGILGGHLGFFLSETEIRNVVTGRFSEMVTKILELSESKNMSPRKVAERIAQRRFLEKKLKLEQRNLGNVLSQISSEWLSSRLMPETLRRFLAPLRIERARARAQRGVLNETD